MQTERKAQLVQDWGFERHASGFYFRDIYSDHGYREMWTKGEPDLIKFLKGGEWSHNYEIDWSLYN